MTDTLKPSEVLDKAADLITPEGAWTQGYFARVAPGGNSIGPREPNAACWCAFGAVINRCGNDGAAEDFAVQYLRTTLRDSIDRWNDAPERTQAEVIAALRQAAQLAREEGQ